MPPGFLEPFRDHPCVLNRSVTDISKRAISELLVASPDDCDGPVIVKTNRNHGGVPEHRLFAPSPWRDRWHKLLPYPRKHRAVATFLRTGRLKPKQYPIYPTASDVPDHVWTCDGLVVERFVPERDGDLYCTSTYCFLGDVSVTVLKWSPEPVLRSGTVVRREFVDVPEEIAAKRRALGFDFGKFDYVVHEGRPILLDVNPTPAFGNPSLEPRLQEIVRTVAAGIDRYVSRRPLEPISGAT